MKVSEFIELLKTFPQDAEVAAYDTTETMAIVLKGGVVLNEGNVDFGPYDANTDCGDREQCYPRHKGPYVSIEGGEYTSHGWIKEGG